MTRTFAIGRSMSAKRRKQTPAILFQDQAACGQQGPIETARQGQSRRDPTGEDGYN